MLIPNELLVQERHQELLREAAKVHLVHLVTASVSDRLQKYGTAVLNSAKKQDEKTNKN
jgi:hypothetical protein